MTVGKALMVAVLLAAAGCSDPPLRTMEHRPPAASSGGEATTHDPAASDVPQAEPFQMPAEPTLADYLAQAASSNPSLLAAFNRWQAAGEMRPQVTALSDPRLSYRYFMTDIERTARPGANSMELTQEFPWFGKLHVRGLAADAAAEAEHQQYEARKLALFYEVKDAYYEYYYLGRAVAVIEQNVRLLEDQESVVRQQYSAGSASFQSLSRLQIEVARLHENLASMQDRRGPLAAKLLAAVNLPGGRILPWPAEVEPAAASFEPGQLLALAHESNPQLKAMQAEIDKADRDVELARKEYFPDVMFGMEWMTERPGNAGGMPPGVPDSESDMLIAMVSINVPIWWDKLSAGVRQARYQRLASAHSRSEFANTLAADLEEAAYRHRDAQRKLDLYRILLPKANESLKVSETSFRGGSTGYGDLTEAVRTLLDIQLNYEQALADRARSLARLEMLVGRQLPRSADADAGQQPSTEERD